MRRTSVIISINAVPSCVIMRFNISGSSSFFVTLRPRAPHPFANSEKSGLCRSVAQTSSSPDCCSLEIFPSSELFSRIILIFMSYFTEVANSAIYCANPPSPATAITGSIASGGSPRPQGCWKCKSNGTQVS